MPELVYYYVMPVLIGNNDHTKDTDGYYIIRCSDEFPSVFLLIDDHWFEVPPSTFIFAIPGYPDYCYVGIHHVSDDYWLIGDTFLRGYYSVWDNPNNRIGLAPHKTSIAKIIAKNEKNPMPSSTFTPI